MFDFVPVYCYMVHRDIFVEFWNVETPIINKISTFVPCVYVHGINNGLSDIPHVTNVFDFFHKQVRSKNSLLEEKARIAFWRSSGSFVDDLQLIFTRPSLRDYAVHDVRTQIVQALSSTATGVIVVGHSMGQVLSYLALKQMPQSYLDRVGFVSLGGPLGNTNPIYRKYLSTIGAGPDDGFRPRFWHDVANFDDPICCNVQGQVSALAKNMGVPDLVLSLLPKHLRSEASYEKLDCMDTSTFIDVPGLPPPSDPFAEHGSYFYADACAQLVADSAKSIFSLE